MWHRSSFRWFTTLESYLLDLRKYGQAFDRNSHLVFSKTRKKIKISIKVFDSGPSVMNQHCVMYQYLRLRRVFIKKKNTIILLMGVILLDFSRYKLTNLIGNSTIYTIQSGCRQQVPPPPSQQMYGHVCKYQ